MSAPPAATARPADQPTNTRPGDQPATQGGTAPTGRLDRYFEISRRGSTIARETRAGLTTFSSVAYIVVLNPIILGSAKDVGGHSLPFAAIAAATALVAGLMTLLMGTVGKVPFAVATGLGLNAFVAFGVAPRMSWADAMGLVVISGLVITVLVLTGIRQAVFAAIPLSLKAAIAVGIGLFISLIGFVDSGFVRRIPDAAGTTVPVQLGGNGTLTGWPTLVFVIGLGLAGVLVARKTRAALLLTIAVTTAVAFTVNAFAHPGGAFVGGKPNPTGWALNTPAVPHTIGGTPDLSLIGHFSILGAFSTVGVGAALLVVFTLVLSDFFDAAGTTVGLSREAGLMDDQGNMDRLGRVLLIDGIAAAAGGAASVSSNTTYIESSAGIADGARTGLASVVTGLLFLAAMFLTPLVAMVPSEAAAPVLVIVGVLMMGQVRHIDFTDPTVAVPAFLTIVLMPFTYSISVGLGVGLVSFVLLSAATGKARSVHPLMWGIAGAFVLFFAQPFLSRVLGLG